jgi:hypothetical protein
MASEQDDYASYASYLLRLWKSDQAGQPTWRASLESASDGQKVNFASLEALLAFLNDRFGPLGEEHKAKNVEGRRQ